MNDSVVMLLAVIAGIILFCIVILIASLVIINVREKRRKMKEKDNVKLVNKSNISYTNESIEDFMDFEKIEDNMIIQKNGEFLMVIECHGINYDLMSEMEKVSVEQGFIAFLNTLRYPIQLYIQTRTINLERSIDGYKTKLQEIERNYNARQIEYENILKNEEATKEDIDKAKYELVKQKNLKEYTADIIRDIERQSLNRSILSKRYYVIVPCYQSEIEAGEFDKTEVKNMAFSELYTRSRAIINSLFACQVTGKVLNTEELVELLYIAYNRDESDLFWMEKMKQAGFDELYSTAPDVIERKIKLLDKQIDEQATLLANKKITEVRREKEIEALEKEKNEQEFINQRAKEMLNKHKRYIGEDVALSAIERIEESEKENKQTQVKKSEEEKSNVQEKGKKGRGRKKE